MNAVSSTRKHSLRRYLVAGVVVWLPILATVWVVNFLLHIMDRTLLLLPAGVRPEALLGFRIPGLGLLFALLAWWRIIRMKPGRRR